MGAGWGGLVFYIFFKRPESNSEVAADQKTSGLHNYPPPTGRSRFSVDLVHETALVVIETHFFAVLRWAFREKQSHDGRACSSSSSGIQ